MAKTVGIIASSYNVPAGGGSAQAIRTSGQWYSRSASGLGGSIDFTVACWAKLATGAAVGFAMFMGIDNAGSRYNSMGTGSSASRLLGRIHDGGDFFGPGTPSVVLNTWYYCAFVNIAGATQDHFMFGTSTTLTDVTDGAGTGTLDTCTFYMASDGFGLSLNGSLACARIWTAALTKTELEAEMVKVDPVRTANLWAAYSFRNGPQTNDESGNGRTITLSVAGGSIATDTAGPPVT